MCNCSQNLFAVAVLCISVQIYASPLHKAAGVGDLVRVKALLKQNLSPNDKLEGGWTVLVSDQVASNLHRRKWTLARYS